MIIDASRSPRNSRPGTWLGTSWIPAKNGGFGAGRSCGVGELRSAILRRELDYGLAGASRSPSSVAAAAWVCAIPIVPESLTVHEEKAPADCSPDGPTTGFEFASAFEARTGFEPAYNGFANRCLTTWLPRHFRQRPTLPGAWRRSSPFDSVSHGERSTRR